MICIPSICCSHSTHKIDRPKLPLFGTADKIAQPAYYCHKKSPSLIDQCKSRHMTQPHPMPNQAGTTSSMGAAGRWQGLQSSVSCCACACACHMSA